MAMTTRQRRYFTFARYFNGHMVALDALEYLSSIQEFRGSYRLLSRRVTGNENNASNVHKAIEYLVEIGAVAAESTLENRKKDRQTLIVVRDEWKNMFK